MVADVMVRVGGGGRQGRAAEDHSACKQRDGEAFCRKIKHSSLLKIDANELTKQRSARRRRPRRGPVEGEAAAAATGTIAQKRPRKHWRARIMANARPSQRQLIQLPPSIL
jgi:hypothetical protein